MAATSALGVQGDAGNCAAIAANAAAARRPACSESRSSSARRNQNASPDFGAAASVSRRASRRSASWASRPGLPPMSTSSASRVRCSPRSESVAAAAMPSRHSVTAAAWPATLSRATPTTVWYSAVAPAVSAARRRRPASSSISRACAPRESPPPTRRCDQLRGVRPVAGRRQAVEPGAPLRLGMGLGAGERVEERPRGRGVSQLQVHLRQIVGRAWIVRAREILPRLVRLVARHPQAAAVQQRLVPHRRRARVHRAVERRAGGVEHAQQQVRVADQAHRLGVTGRRAAAGFGHLQGKHRVGVVLQVDQRPAARQLRLGHPARPGVPRDQRLGVDLGLLPPVAGLADAAGAFRRLGQPRVVVGVVHAVEVRAAARRDGRHRRRHAGAPRRVHRLPSPPDASRRSYSAR